MKTLFRVLAQTESSATCVFYPGELVWGSLRFQAKEYHPQGDQSKLSYLMDITAQDIVKLNP